MDSWTLRDCRGSIPALIMEWRYYWYLGDIDVFSTRKKFIFSSYSKMLGFDLGLVMRLRHSPTLAHWVELRNLMRPKSVLEIWTEVR